MVNGHSNTYYEFQIAHNTEYLGIHLKITPHTADVSFWLVTYGGT